jgi:hypothetical protein
MSQYFNSYQFVGADPINYRDLDGNFGWLTHTAVGLLEGHSYYEALGDWYRETNFLIEENDGIRWLAGKVHTVYKSEMEKFQTLSVEELNKKSGLNLSEAEWDGIKSHAKHDWYHEREHETYSPIESFVHTQFGPEAGSWYQDIEDVGVLGGIGFYTLYPLVQPLIDLVLPLTGLPQGSLPAIVTPIFGIIAMDQAISIIGIVNKDYRGETYVDYGQM